MVLVRSASDMAPITRTTSAMLEPVVVVSWFRLSPISRWKPLSPTNSTRALKSPRLAADTTTRWPSTTCASLATVLLAYSLSSPNAPSYFCSIVLLRSPSDTAPITRTTSLMLAPVVMASWFKPSPISRWKPCKPLRSTRASKLPRLAAATTMRWPSTTWRSLASISLTANSMLVLPRLHIGAQVAFGDTVHQVGRIGRLTTEALDQVAGDQPGDQAGRQHRQHRQRDDQLARFHIHFVGVLSFLVHQFTLQFTQGFERARVGVVGFGEIGLDELDRLLRIVFRQGIQLLIFRCQNGALVGDVLEQQASLVRANQLVHLSQCLAYLGAVALDHGLVFFTLLIAAAQQYVAQLPAIVDGVPDGLVRQHDFRIAVFRNQFDAVIQCRQPQHAHHRQRQ